ncbi:MAG: hypothetical protein ACYDCL_01620 [Myxococcales bacterium]
MRFGPGVALAALLCAMPAAAQTGGCVPEGALCSTHPCCAGLACEGGEAAQPSCRAPALTDAGCLAPGGACVRVELADGGSYQPACCGGYVCVLAMVGDPESCAPPSTSGGGSTSSGGGSSASGGSSAGGGGSSSGGGAASGGETGGGSGGSEASGTSSHAAPPPLGGGGCGCQAGGGDGWIGLLIIAWLWERRLRAAGYGAVVVHSSTS